MLRTTLVGVALLASACGKKEPRSEAVVPTGSGSASAPAVASASAGSAASAPVDPKATLDAVLKSKGIADKAIAKRATGPHSAWALVVSKSRDNGFYVTEYTIIRASKDGVALLSIAAKEGGTAPSLEKDVDTFEARDLDGDGHDECLAVLEWDRSFNFPYAKGCKTCEYGEGESGKQLYVVADKNGSLAIAFTHLVEYATLSQPGSSEDPDPPPAEKVAYEWKVDGSPPIVTLTRTDNELNAKRPKELLDPATDPLLAGGSGSTMPLVLK